MKQLCQKFEPLIYISDDAVYTTAMKTFALTIYPAWHTVMTFATSRTESVSDDGALLVYYLSHVKCINTPELREPQ